MKILSPVKTAHFTGPRTFTGEPISPVSPVTNGESELKNRLVQCVHINFTGDDFITSDVTGEDFVTITAITGDTVTAAIFGLQLLLEKCHG